MFWNPGKVVKSHTQVLVKDLEFADEVFPRRFILYPTRRTIDKGVTYFRDFDIKQDFREWYNIWWSNFYQAYCHKEGVSFCKKSYVKMFKDRLWKKNAAESVRNAKCQITSWGSEVWGLDKDGLPKELPKYIQNSRYSGTKRSLGWSFKRN